MEKIGRLEIVKIVVAPAIALFVAIVGWALAASYNSAQRDLATQRAEADVEVARINAAMRYMELVRDIPERESVQRQQAISIAVPVLPPELAFQLAINQLRDDPAALDILVLKYGNEAFAYLVRHLEVPFGDLKLTLNPHRTAGILAVQPTHSESRADLLLRYLRQRGQSEDLFEYLISDTYTNESFRAIALLLYFVEYKASLKNVAGATVQEAYRRVRLDEEFLSYLRMPSLSAHTKQAIAFASSIAFGTQFERECDIFFQEVASRYWVNLDVARGATPVEDSFQGYLYEHAFRENRCHRDALTRTSASLRNKILGLNIDKLGMDKVRLLLYAYAASNSLGPNPAYLVPADVVKVMRFILNWADTAERRKQLSMMLGSISGHHVFYNMMPSGQQMRATTEEHSESCEAARAFVKMLFYWYEKHHSADWFIPKFFHDVANEFPDLENRINREAWGLRNPGPLEKSRGCRELDNDRRL